MEYFDQTGYKVMIQKDVKRIISLVPSQTELLFDMGLDERVVGITKFCVHPKEWKDSKVKIGGTKKLNFERISVLNPDLVIANKEENTKEDIIKLRSLFPVWTSDIQDLSSALLMIDQLGEICRVQNKAKIIINNINVGFKQIQSPINKSKVIYLIWKNPIMAVGNETFISDMLRKCGFINVLNHRLRYPELNNSDILDLNPDFIFLSTEPYPFDETSLIHFKKEFPLSKIKTVNGEMFSWYGSRLQQSPVYFQELINILGL